MLSTIRFKEFNYKGEAMRALGDLKKYIDITKMSLVKAGDFKKVQKP